VAVRQARNKRLPASEATSEGGDSMSDNDFKSKYSSRGTIIKKNATYAGNNIKSNGEERHSFILPTHLTLALIAGGEDDLPKCT
jgi:hypothetical protein